MSRRDPYDVLEIDRNASDEEIRRAWRRLTLVWHPDRFENDPELRTRAEERFKEINEAYQELERRGRTSSREDGRRGRAAGDSAGQGSGRSRHAAHDFRGGPDAHDAGASRGPEPLPVWRVRDDAQEVQTDDPQQIVRWIHRGNVAADDEVLVPGTDSWVRLGDLQPFASMFLRVRMLRWARLGFLFLALLGLVLRRPVLVMMGIGFLFLTHVRS